MIYFSIIGDDSAEQALAYRMMRYAVENNLLEDNVYLVVRPIMGVQEQLHPQKPVIYGGYGGAYYKNTNGYYTYVYHVVRPRLYHRRGELRREVRIISPFLDGKYSTGYNVTIFEPCCSENIAVRSWVASYDVQQQKWHELV